MRAGRCASARGLSQNSFRELANFPIFPCQSEYFFCWVRFLTLDREHATVRWTAGTTSRMQPTTHCTCEHAKAFSPGQSRRESWAQPIWELASQREPQLVEPHHWRTSVHVPRRNVAPHKPASVPRPEMASVSDKSGKCIRAEDRYAA